ncbi:MAG: GNAT family N-acetyltransferase [Trichodesmium sp. MAG_R01]|jgi:RimJ/RimL family protein N-acetyltransferase|nr:GNAT family N-acetyltransferase [Trichodesmium sp. MAG_R01]
MSKSLYLGRKLLYTLKATTGTEQFLCLPVGLPIRAILRPIATKPEALNPDDIRCLTEWRNRCVKSFLTEFQATESRTTRWLTETVQSNDQKILFMVDDLNGRTFGYMGLDFINWETGDGEADAIVKGQQAPPGTMKIALQTLLSWALSQLGLSSLRVRVRSDNTALEFYQKVGFTEKCRVPLRRIDELDMIRWVEDASLKSADLSLVYMSY